MKLVTKTFILLLIIIPRHIHAQLESQHLFGKEWPVEWSMYLAPEVKYSALYGKGELYGGLKGALLFNHHYSFGLSFGSFVTEAVTDGPGTQGDTVGLNTVMMYGGFYLDYVTSFNEGDTNAPAFASLGLNIKPVSFGKSRFFTCLGLGVVTDSWLFYIITLKYVYNVNRFLGFTSSVRYPFYGKSAFMTIGLQIFTN